MEYKDYISTFEKYAERDHREIHFQNEIVKPFLRSVLPELFVEDVHSYFNKGGHHDFSQYAGETSEYISSQPDLVICDNWHTENKISKENTENEVKKVNYNAIVEVKSPFLEPIFHLDPLNYLDTANTVKESGLREKAKDLLRPMKVKKLIFTDTLKWEFYYISDEGIIVKTIQLHNNEKNPFKSRAWTWRNEEAYEELKRFVRGFI
ncbi:hypothetical protein [Mammaliicoccus sp. Dog046]|uniref:hypothetical protein n=1 Tax=Mammaliicoccus sp. Dog046 TaxID=3034233 RepID=UPI002B25E4B9|nr:hypothetical protein [Mammaliicoccus sp. Dog046]WQK86023.1 hypothetical protein P3U32_03030 [Mammaliicoccus sp. Dog046]